MTLVDTSVWVDHFRRRNGRLDTLLQDGHVVCHPFVVGELACGNLRNRQEILGLLAALPEATTAEHREVLHLVDVAGLFGRGLGWVDAHLLASARLTGCAFWTLDNRLRRAAASLNLPE
jgi:hypothetical protein